MNKKIAVVLMVSISILAAGCSKVKEQTVTNAAPNTAASKTADGTSNSQTSTAPSKTETAAPAEASDYSKYSGQWITEENLKIDVAYGIGIYINVDKSGNFTGSVGDSTSGFSHIANADIKGRLENGTATCNFTEDGWGHSGTVKLQLKDNTVILTVKYDEKSEKIDSGWEVKNGTVKLVNINTPTKRTIGDLRKGGWTDVANQCFDINLDKYGKIKFITETNKNMGFNFYLQDSQGNIVYKFQESYRTEYDSKNVTMDSVSAISFQDINNDGLKDVIVLYNGVDTSKNNAPVSFCNIFVQKSGGEFATDKALTEKVNKSKNTKDIKTIVDYLKQNK